MARIASRAVVLWGVRPPARSLTALLWRAHHGESRIVESPWPAVDIPDQTVPEFVWERIEKFAQKPAITCGVTGRSYNYGQAREMTRRFAWSLLADGQLKKGDTVGILLPNIPEYMAAVHGVIEAGLVPTFVNPLYTPDEVSRQFVNANVRSCITIPQLMPAIVGLVSKISNYWNTVVVGQTIHEPATRTLSFQAMIMEATPVTLPKLSPDEIAVLPYSSGTTGLPKGVILTHRNLVSNMVQTDIADINPFRETNPDKQDVTLSMLPFFHIYGFNGAMNIAMRYAMHLVSIPRFVPEDYIAALVKYRPRCLFVVPSLLSFLAGHPSVTSEHLSSVEVIISGAAAATKTLIDKYRKKLCHTKCSVRQGFGMTESSPVATFGSINIPADKLDSIGFLIPNTQARVVDIDTQKDLTHNQSGELWIRGPQVMKGYLNDERATKETVDSEGWLHTGDVAYYDEQGYFYIVDRTKELIKVKGHQVSPTELENLVMQVDGVIDVAVVGIPDKISGEIPLAFVVCRPGVNVTEEQIVEYVKPKVAPYKRLAGGIRKIDVIPRNPAGKVLRHQLKALCVAEMSSKE